MVQTASTMLPLGTVAPKFSLPDADGKRVSIDDLRGKKALLVVFISNHCPFVKHILKDFVRVATEYLEKGVAVVAINSNDAAAYPEDAPDEMRKAARKFRFTFPNLHDESQEVAKAYRAACTPDFFLFDAGRKLVYRGQFDGSRPGNNIPVTGGDLRAAMDAILAGKPAPKEQRASIGCNIKWKPCNEPDYFKA